MATKDQEIALGQHINEHAILGTNTNIPYKRSNVIGMKPTGTNVSGGSSAGRVWSLKIAAPAEYYSVRLFIYHHEASSTTSYTAICASTESALNTTAINLTRPIVNGAESNALDAVESYGWKTFKFAGISAITAPAGTAIAPSVLISDWLPLASVPRADGAAFPLALIRLSVLGGTSNFSSATNTGPGMEIPDASNGGLILQARWESDATGVTVSAPATNHLSASNAATPTIGIEFRCNKPGITIMGIGDSLTQQTTVSPSVYDTMGWRTAARISALGVPCGYVNHGMSGQASLAFTNAGLAAITNWLPNAVFVQGGSPNDGAFSTDAFMRNGIQKMNSYAQGVLVAAAAENAVQMITTWLPCSSGIIPAESQDVMRRVNNTAIRALANNRVFVLDWDALVSDGGAPARIAAQYQFDATHPNATAIELQAQQLTDVVKRAFVI